MFSFAVLWFFGGHLLESTGIGFDEINYHGTGQAPPMPETFATREDILNGFRALTAPGTGFIEHQNSGKVNLIYVRVKDYEGSDRFFTIVINRWHDNINTMFEEQNSELALALDEIAERIRALGIRAP